jgi:hypothetical protein
MLLAAGLLRLTADADAETLASAALVVIIRKIASGGLAAGPREPPGAGSGMSRRGLSHLRRRTRLDPGRRRTPSTAEQHRGS